MRSKCGNWWSYWAPRGFRTRMQLSRVHATPLQTRKALQLNVEHPKIRPRVIEQPVWTATPSFRMFGHVDGESTSRR
jgi:hypothetical protein